MASLNIDLLSWLKGFFYTEAEVDSLLSTKQDSLVSGENIKTVNNSSLLGSGNIEIQGGSSVDIVTAWESTTSDEKVPSEKLTKDSLDGKANSSHTHTTSDVTDFPSIPSKISDLTNDSDFIETSSTTGLIKNDGTVDTTTYSTFSGSYTDLSNKPTIPSKTSDLSNDSNFISTSSTSGLIKNDGSIDTSTYITSSAISGKEDTSNKVTSWSSTVNDTHYPSEKLVKDSLDGKANSSHTHSASEITTANNQSVDDDLLELFNNKVSKSNTTGLLKNDGTVDTTSYLSSLPSHNHDDRYYTESEVDNALSGKQATLVSGTNIKTINNTSLLGSGNISIQGGGSVTVDSALSTTSENPVQNKVITGALNDKADTSSIPSKTSDLTNDGADGTNVFIADNDSRLSDARTPTAHTHLTSDVEITSAEVFSELDNTATAQDGLNLSIDNVLSSKVNSVTFGFDSTNEVLYLEVN